MYQLYRLLCKLDSDEVNENGLHTYTTIVTDQLHVQHNFHSRRVLEALVNDEAFVDVTLTAEGRTISAHKVAAFIIFIFSFIPGP